MKLRFTARSVVVLTGVLITNLFAGQPLVYQFKGAMAPIYEVTVQAELPDSTETYSGHVAYKITAAKPPGDEISFGYTPTFKTVKKQNQQDNDGRIGMPPPMPPFGQMFAMPRNAAEIIIDRTGDPLQPTRPAVQAESRRPRAKPHGSSRPRVRRCR
ncbi:hypothetical protein BH10PLA1_BH10PLA1_08410 [soil metagenome]